MLRERKSALGKLFEIVGLRPVAGAQTGDQDGEGRKVEGKRRAGKKVTEIVGDGEEIEVDDSEVIDGNDIAMIYTRYEGRVSSLLSVLTALQSAKERPHDGRDGPSAIIYPKVASLPEASFAVRILGFVHCCHTHNFQLDACTRIRQYGRSAS